MVEFTRRSLIAALTATGVIAVGTSIASSDVNAQLRAIILRCVGSFHMQDPEFSALINDFKTTKFRGGRARFRTMVALAYNAAGSKLPSSFPAFLQQASEFERAIVTHFLIQTDYIKVTHTSDVSFVKSIACNSPFARFD